MRADTAWNHPSSIDHDNPVIRSDAPRPAIQRVIVLWAAAVISLSISTTPASAQSLAGPFLPFNSWWIHPTQGTGGVLLNVNDICIDRDGDGSAESCYPIPNIAPGQALSPLARSNARLSPTRKFLLAFGDPCQTIGQMAYFFSIPDPPDSMTLVDSACIDGGINAGHIGFYDTGLCNQGLIGLECASLGVSPQRIAYIADVAPSGSRLDVYWFDLVAGTHATTPPGFNQALPLTRLQVSPFGDAAFVQHNGGASPDSDYTVVDLCPAPRLGQALSSNVGGALFNLPTPTATADLVDLGGGAFAARVTHPFLLSGSIDVSVTPCSGTPPPTPGACCLTDATCSAETLAACEALSGTWLGPDTDCADCPLTTLDVTVIGPGTVTSSPPGIACPADCTQDFGLDSSVTLTAAPAAGAMFSGWSSHCFGQELQFPLTMSVDRQCTAMFQGTADLSIQKTDAPDPVVAGRSLTYRLTVANLGPFDADGVTITDPLPAGVSFNFGLSSGGCGESGGVVSCLIGALPGGQNSVVEIVVDVDPSVRGTLTNTASVAGNQPDPDLANNSDGSLTEIDASADLSIAKSANPEPLRPGGWVAYEIVITNTGPSTATNVSLTDTLPPGLSTLTGLGSSVNPTQIACNLADIPPGTARTALIAVVDESLPDGTMLNNTVDVTAAEPDGNPGDNTASAVSTVRARSCRRYVRTIQKLVDDSTPMPGFPGDFVNFGTPALDGSNVAFTGINNDAGIFAGIYTIIGGVLERVADESTIPPGGTSPFSGFSSFDPMEGTDVVFSAIAPSGGGGFFGRTGGVLQKLIRLHQHLPGTGGGLANFSSPSFHQGQMAFFAIASTITEEGAFLWDGVVIEEIATRQTPIPDGLGNFTNFIDFGLGSVGPAIYSGTVAFAAQGILGQDGIYTNQTGTLRKIADTNTPIPGGAGTFTQFGPPSMDRGLIAFVGDGTGQSGIYIADCLGVHLIADLNTPAPEAGGQTFTFIGRGFPGPGTLAMDGVDVAFSALAGTSGGLYLSKGGELIRFIPSPFEFEGAMRSPAIGPYGLEGNQLAFAATSLDLRGVFLARLEDPHPGDVDADGDSDLVDYSMLDQCMGMPVSADPLFCGCADIDNNAIIDLRDYGHLFDCINGPGVVPACPLPAAP